MRPSARAVDLFRRLYRVLLLRWPRTLRRRHGAAMEELFARQLEEAMEREGWRGAARVWGTVLAETVRGLPKTPLPTRTTTRASGLRDGLARTLSATVSDVRFAGRSLRREPRFTLSLVGILTMGVALNATVFAVVNAYLLRPLPYPHPERVVQVRAPGGVHFDDAEGLFERRVSWDLDAFTLVGEAGSELARGAWVTPDFLDVYGVTPALGRRFREDEGRPGSEASVALISDRLWQRRFGSDPDVLGSTIRAYTSDRPDDAEAFTIVGVLPRDFWHFNDYTDVLAPLRGQRALYAGRLAPGVTTEDAARTLTARVAARSTGLPDDFGVLVERTHRVYVASIRPTLLTLQLATLLVFAITSVNAMVLILVRAVRRERELGVRRALGADRGRLTRQLVAEGVLPALLAGVAGLAVASVGLEMIRGMEALAAWRGIPGGTGQLRIDAWVAGWILAASVATGVVFGLIPVVSGAVRRASASATARAGRGDTRSRRRFRTVVLAGEVALSLALLTGAGLMMRSASNLQSADLGFDPRDVTRGQVGLRQASYPDPSDRIAFFEQLGRQVGTLPGVEDVGFVGAAPFTWGFDASPIDAEGGRSAEGVYQIASAGFFSTFDVELLRGRLFEPTDVTGATPVAVVSETLAAQLAPGSDAIGLRIRDPFPDGPEAESVTPGPWFTIVGVVGDVRKAVGGSRAGDVYFNHAHVAPFWLNLVVRRRPGTPSPETRIAEIIGELDPAVPFSTVTDMGSAVDAAMAPSRFLAGLFAVFAGVALLLAVFGLYVVTSFVARQTRRGVAIRMALGADRHSVHRMFLGQGALVVSVGFVFGSAGGIRLGQALRGQLHGVDPFDPATLLVVAALLGIPAMLAVWLPARDASRAPPASVLREE